MSAPQSDGGTTTGARAVRRPLAEPSVEGDAIRPATEPVDPSFRWRDPKRYLWSLGLVVPLLPVAAWASYGSTGIGAFLWMGPVWIFLLIPLLDWVLGEDRANPPDSAVAQLEASRYYRWITYAYLPLQYATLVWAAWLVAHHQLPVIDMVGLALTVGLVGGVGINTAHELGHKRDGTERWLSRVALAQTWYGHFFVEHNRGHHSRVATPEDPASSRFGESFWAFLPRTVVGSVRSAWDLEGGRLQRNGHPAVHPRNKILQAWAMSVVLYGVLIGVLGTRVIPFVLIEVVFGFSLLEVVNYLEHYGLARQRVANGRYERTMPRHSWNSNHVASNLALFNLERHSDHHANPTRRYQTLRHFDEAPQLPSGYGLMLGLATVPPVWRKVMDKRVLALYDGDITRANIQPSKREKVLRAYGG